jgi:hypothetical protein
MNKNLWKVQKINTMKFFPGFKKNESLPGHGFLRNLSVLGVEGRKGDPPSQRLLFESLF